MKLPFTFEKQPMQPGYDNPSHTQQNDSADGQDILGLSDLYVPEESIEAHVRDVADILLETNRITPEQHAELRREQSQRPGADSAALLLKANLCGQDDILAAKAQMCGLEFRHIKPDEVDRQAFEVLDLDFIKTSSICPIAVQQDMLVVATSEPANLFAIEEVKRQTQMDLQVVVCTQQDIDAVCAAFNEDSMDGNFDDIISDMTEVEIVQDEEDTHEDLEKMAGQSPVIKFVNFLISNAIREGASGAAENASRHRLTNQDYG
jgi:type IV pilus assembly protein PilB